MKEKTFFLAGSSSLLSITLCSSSSYVTGWILCACTNMIPRCCCCLRSSSLWRNRDEIATVSPLFSVSRYDDDHSRAKRIKMALKGSIIRIVIYEQLPEV